jgi:hypothetical protein
MSGLTAYRSLINLQSSLKGLQSPKASHYSGNFGFNSLSIKINHNSNGENSRLRKATEAHEALHAFQVFTQQPARELFRAIQIINRYRFLYLGMLVENVIRLKTGETIFESASRGLIKHYTPADRQIEDACNTVLSCYKQKYGVSVMNLIEGSARAIELLNHGENVIENLESSDELYKAAWLEYRKKGGNDVRVFAQVCTASLRYGSIDPIFSDTYPHPSELFSYLTNFSNYFEGIANSIDIAAPKFSDFTPPGDYDEFGPIRDGKSEKFLKDAPFIKTKDHFFPDEMFEEHIETALEGYKSSDRDQIALEDRLFGVSTAIADAIEIGYSRVADPMGVSRLTDRKLSLDLIQQVVFQHLPGLYIEEVSIKALVDTKFQERIANVFKENIAAILVKPWTGEEKEIPVELLSHFYEVAESIDWLSLAEGAMRERDTATWQQIKPTCCPIHRADMRSLVDICNCENEGGINRNFGELFGVDLADFMRG